MANNKSSAQLQIGDIDWARAKDAEGCKDPYVSHIIGKDKAKKEKEELSKILCATPNGGTPSTKKPHP